MVQRYAHIHFCLVCEWMRVQLGYCELAQALFDYLRTGWIGVCSPRNDFVEGCGMTRNISDIDLEMISESPTFVRNNLCS